MPTYDCSERFNKDFSNLDRDDQLKFKAAVAQFIEDLSSHSRRLRKGRRVKGVQDAAGVFEMTWASDGRATFQFGPEQRDGEPHIVWRRVGTHDILDRP